MFGQSVLSPKGRKHPVHVAPKTEASLQDVIFEALHENAMRDAMVLYFNAPLLAMQKNQGILPKRVKSLEDIYETLLKIAFENKRTKLALPKSSSKKQIALALAQNLN